MTKAFNRQLAEQPVTIFTVMSALARQHDAVNLGQGFPDQEGPQDMIRLAADALLDGQNQYAPLTGLPELRTAVAQANLRYQGISVDADSEIIVTSGATEALAASLMALIEPGDEVVLMEPLYDTYLPVIRQLGGIARIVRLQAPDWALPRQALADAFSPRTKAILVNSPMNPTGKVFTAEELAFIATLVQKHDTFAICDEVYEHLVFNTPHISLMSLPGMRERCVRIGSAVLGGSDRARDLDRRADHRGRPSGSHRSAAPGGSRGGRDRSRRRRLSARGGATRAAPGCVECPRRAHRRPVRS